MQLDEALHEREPEAEPAARAREASILLRERLEHAGEDVRLDPLAGVAHLEEGVGAGVLAEPHRHRAATGRELGGVAEQVPEDLREPGRVALHRNGRERELHDELEPRQLERKAVVLDRVAHEHREIERHTAELDAAARDARDVEEIVDEAREVPELARHHLARARRAGGVVRRTGEKVQRVPDGRERVAQLVREGAEELVLAPVRLLELLGDGAVALLALLPGALRRLLRGEVDDEGGEPVLLGGEPDEDRDAAAVAPHALALVARAEPGIEPAGGRARPGAEPLRLELLARAADDAQVLVVRELHRPVAAEEEDADGGVAREPLEAGRLRLERAEPELLGEVHAQSEPSWSAARPRATANPCGGGGGGMVAAARTRSTSPRCPRPRQRTSGRTGRASWADSGTGRDACV